MYGCFVVFSAGLARSDPPYCCVERDLQRVRTISLYLYKSIINETENILLKNTNKFARKLDRAYMRAVIYNREL